MAPNERGRSPRFAMSGSSTGVLDVSTCFEQRAKVREEQTHVTLARWEFARARVLRTSVQ